MRKALLALMLLLPATPSLAHWASGGGEVLLDTQNPWFIQNTTTVDVCLIWDQTNFHPVDRDFAGLKARFDDSITYWKNEFAKSYMMGKTGEPPFVSVATQDFRVVATESVGNGQGPSARCEAADLKVQFGYLSAEQLRFFETRMGGVQQYLASTVRTDYDAVHMKGKGFIYLKPDTGPLSANSPRVVQNPWGLGRGTLVNYALLHELGHMFGIPHKSLESFMAVDFLERSFDINQAADNATSVPNNGFFSWNRGEPIRVSEDVSTRRSGWKRLLNIPEGDKELEVRFEGADKIAFYTSPDDDIHGPGRLRGTMTYDPTKVTYMWEEAVRLYLPQEQTVLDVTQMPGGSGYAPWILGPMVKNEEFLGTFVSADGKTKHQMIITTSPQGLGFAASRFSAEMDGQWYQNLDWVY